MIQIKLDSQILTNIRIKNLGESTTDFYINVIASIINFRNPNFENILLDGRNLFGFNVAAPHPDATNFTRIERRPGQLSILNLEPREVGRASLISPFRGIPGVGIYDIGIESGLFNVEENNIIQAQSRQVRQNAFEVTDTGILPKKIDITTVKFSDEATII